MWDMVSLQKGEAVGMPRFIEKLQLRQGDGIFYDERSTNPWRVFKKNFFPLFERLSSKSKA
jgi:hypothetical protein|tara:strand:- start:308 stop:490 length:183 start_codon:yes stop_codon:yes gene_type:complete